MSTSKYVLEQAKSGRSKCKGSCKQQILKGAARLGTLVEINGSSSYSWRCLSCITVKVAQNAGGEASAIEGFESLDHAQQATVIAAFSGLASVPAAATSAPKLPNPTVVQQHQFLDKAKEYDFEAVRTLVSDNPGYVNCQPSGRWSALHQAAEAGNVETVQFLLDHGADVSVLTRDSKTPLDVAHKDVRSLLASGRPLKRPKMESPPADVGSVLYMENPISAATLSEESGSGTPWIVGGEGEENLADAAVMHRDLQHAPATARGVAQRMSQALAGARLPASESDTQGRVVVIAGAGSTGTPSKSALLSALGLKQHVDGKVLLDEAQVMPKDFSGPNAAKGFCFMDDDDDEDDEEDEDKASVKATTAIMASALTNHFELNFSDEIVVAPVLYGGRAADGNVVAVLSMRVWT